MNRTFEWLVASCSRTFLEKVLTSYRYTEPWRFCSLKKSLGLGKHGVCSHVVLKGSTEGLACQALCETPQSVMSSRATLTLKTLEIFIAIYHGTLTVFLKKQCKNHLEVSATLQGWDCPLTLEQWVTLTLPQSHRLLNGWIRTVLLPPCAGCSKK